jgi:very-short-patch-repair endonuclease
MGNGLDERRQASGLQSPTWSETVNYPREYAIQQRTLRERAAQLRRESTPAEQALWAQMKGHRLGGLHFRRQCVIDRFIVDFYCHSARLAVELDGGVHDEGRERDQERDHDLRSLGINILRFPNRRVLSDMAGVLAEILRAAEEVSPQATRIA